MPRGVKVVNARRTGVRDWERDWLRLKLEEDSVGFARAHGFLPWGASSKAVEEQWRGAPAWSRPEAIGDCDRYEHPAWPTLNGLQWAHAYRLVDRRRGLVYFLCERGG